MVDAELTRPSHDHELHVGDELTEAVPEFGPVPDAAEVTIYEHPDPGTG